VAERFGQLIKHGIVNETAVLEALNLQKKRSIAVGQIALQGRMLSINQVFEVLNAQISTAKLFGELAVEKGLLKNKEVERLLEKQKISRPLLGEILVEMNKITSEDLDVLIKKFKKASKNSKDKSKPARKRKGQTSFFNKRSLSP
jgi:hypothetical protein